jgi:hypothetical protein
LKFNGHRSGRLACCRFPRVDCSQQVPFLLRMTVIYHSRWPGEQKLAGVSSVHFQGFVQ